MLLTVSSERFCFMKKILISSILAILIILSFSSCSSGKTPNSAEYKGLTISVESVKKFGNNDELKKEKDILISNEDYISSPGKQSVYLAVVFSVANTTSRTIEFYTNTMSINKKFSDIGTFSEPIGMSDSDHSDDLTHSFFQKEFAANSSQTFKMLYVIPDDVDVNKLVITVNSGDDGVKNEQISLKGVAVENAS